IRDFHVTGVQTCALPISWSWTKGGRLRVTCWRGRAARSEAWSRVAFTSSRASAAWAGAGALAPMARARAEARRLACRSVMRSFLDIHVCGFVDIVVADPAAALDRSQPHARVRLFPAPIRAALDLDQARVLSRRAGPGRRG